MGWKDTIQTEEKAESAPSWKDTIQTESPSSAAPEPAESFASQFGKSALDALPVVGGAAGGILGAGAAGLPTLGIGAAGGGVVGAGLGTAAGQALSNLGKAAFFPEDKSVPKSVAESFRNTGAAALYGALGEATGIGLSRVAAPVAKAGMDTRLGKFLLEKAQTIPNYSKRGLAKLASFASGVDETAAFRQIERPVQTAAAEADGFAFKVGQNAVDEISAQQGRLGAKVGQAEGELLAQSARDAVDNTPLIKKIDTFLERNRPSPSGFSGIDEGQRETLNELKAQLNKGSTVEDFVKIRDYLDHVERLAGKYDQAGTSPYVNVLKGLRGEADGILDKMAPKFDEANSAYRQFKIDQGTLGQGATNEAKSEALINNLYGRNKSAQQEAAGRVFSPETLDKVQDVASNKAFSGAIGPAGSDQGQRRLAGAVFAIPTFGLSTVVTSPRANQIALRGAGRLGEALAKTPEVYGRFAPMLQKAAERGAAALTTTEFLLQKTDPEFRRLQQEQQQEQE